MERGRRGFFHSFAETWKLAATEPARFFRQVRIGQTSSAVLFGVLALTVGNWVSLVFSYLTANVALPVPVRWASASPWMAATANQTMAMSPPQTGSARTRKMPDA